MYYFSNRCGWSKKLVSSFILITFLSSLIVRPAGAQVLTPGTVPALLGTVPGNVFKPTILLGLKVHPENPLLFDFIVDQGQNKLTENELKRETEKLVKYFLAALTIPDKEVWVNLSPTEKDRIIPDVLGQTVMGKTMLEQDYTLKQLAASLTNPDTELGKKYWAEVGNGRDRSLQDLSKVWIMPAKAEVLEKDGIVLVGEKRLKVMMAQEYEKKSLVPGPLSLENANQAPGTNHLEPSSQIFRSLILPKIEQEVNEGKSFADVRQIYNSVILAAWYKKALKESLLGHVYADKSKVAGVETDDKQMKQRIYNQYLEAFKKGVYNLIKEEEDPSGEMIPRKYFSGGIEIQGLGGVGSSALKILPLTAKGEDQILSAASGVYVITAWAATDHGEEQMVRDVAGSQATSSAVLPQDTARKILDLLPKGTREQRTILFSTAMTAAQKIFKGIHSALIGFEADGQFTEAYINDPEVYFKGPIAIEVNQVPLDSTGLTPDILAKVMGQIVGDGILGRGFDQKRDDAQSHRNIELMITEANSAGERIKSINENGQQLLLAEENIQRAFAILKKNLSINGEFNTVENLALLNQYFGGLELAFNELQKRLARALQTEDKQLPALLIDQPIFWGVNQVVKAKEFKKLEKNILNDLARQLLGSETFAIDRLERGYHINSAQKAKDQIVQAQNNVSAILIYIGQELASSSSAGPNDNIRITLPTDRELSQGQFMQGVQSGEITKGASVKLLTHREDAPDGLTELRTRNITYNDVKWDQAHPVDSVFIFVTDMGNMHVRLSQIVNVTLAASSSLENVPVRFTVNPDTLGDRIDQLAKQLQREDQHRYKAVIPLLTSQNFVQVLQDITTRFRARNSGYEKDPYVDFDSIAAATSHNLQLARGIMAQRLLGMTPSGGTIYQYQSPKEDGAGLENPPYNVFVKRLEKEGLLYKSLGGVEEAWATVESTKWGNKIDSEEAITLSRQAAITGSDFTSSGRGKESYRRAANYKTPAALGALLTFAGILEPKNPQSSLRFSLELLKVVQQRLNSIRKLIAVSRDERGYLDFRSEITSIDRAVNRLNVIINYRINELRHIAEHSDERIEAKIALGWAEEATKKGEYLSPEAAERLLRYDMNKSNDYLKPLFEKLPDVVLSTINEANRRDPTRYQGDLAEIYREAKRRYDAIDRVQVEASRVVAKTSGDFIDSPAKPGRTRRTAKPAQIDPEQVLRDKVKQANLIHADVGNAYLSTNLRNFKIPEKVARLATLEEAAVLLALIRRQNRDDKQPVSYNVRTDIDFKKPGAQDLYAARRFLADRVLGLIEVKGEGGVFEAKTTLWKPATFNDYIKLLDNIYHLVDKNVGAHIDEILAASSGVDFQVLQDMFVSHARKNLADQVMAAQIGPEAVGQLSAEDRAYMQSFLFSEKILGKNFAELSLPKNVTIQPGHSELLTRFGITETEQISVGVPEKGIVIPVKIRKELDNIIPQLEMIQDEVAKKINYFYFAAHLLALNLYNSADKVSEVAHFKEFTTAISRRRDEVGAEKFNMNDFLAIIEQLKGTYEQFADMVRGTFKKFDESLPYGQGRGLFEEFWYFQAYVGHLVEAMATNDLERLSVELSIRILAENRNKEFDAFYNSYSDMPLFEDKDRMTKYISHNPNVPESYRDILIEAYQAAFKPGEEDFIAARDGFNRFLYDVSAYVAAVEAISGSKGSLSDLGALQNKEWSQKQIAQLNWLLDGNPVSGEIPSDLAQTAKLYTQFVQSEELRFIQMADDDFWKLMTVEFDLQSFPIRNFGKSRLEGSEKFIAAITGGLGYEPTALTTPEAFGMYIDNMQRILSPGNLYILSQQQGLRDDVVNKLKQMAWMSVALNKVGITPEFLASLPVKEPEPERSAATASSIATQAQRSRMVGKEIRNPPGNFARVTGAFLDGIFQQGDQVKISFRNADGSEARFEGKLIINPGKPDEEITLNAIIQVGDSGERKLRDIVSIEMVKPAQAASAPTQEPLGGIDFDPTNMNLQIKRDGRGVPLPLPQQNLEQINIQGLFPVIIKVIPVNAQTLPLLLGQVTKEPAREPELAASAG